MNVGLCLYAYNIAHSLSVWWPVRNNHQQSSQTENKHSALMCFICSGQDVACHYPLLLVSIVFQNEFDANIKMAR